MKIHYIENYSKMCKKPSRERDFENSPGDAAVGGGLDVVPHVPDAAEEVLAARDHLDRFQIDKLSQGGSHGLDPEKVSIRWKTRGPIQQAHDNPYENPNKKPIKNFWKGVS